MQNVKQVKPSNLFGLSLLTKHILNEAVSTTTIHDELCLFLQVLVIISKW